MCGRHISSMSAQRVFLKIHPAVAASIIGVCLAVLAYLLWPIRALAGQIFLLGIIFLLFRYAPPFVTWLKHLPWAHRVIFGGVLATVLAGHFTLDNRRYFPFVTWEIFPKVREENPVTCRELMAETSHGKKVRLLAEQLYPSIVQFNLPGEDDSPAMGHLVRVLAHRYALLHPGETLQRVDLVRISVPLRPSSAQLSCEFLKRFDISPAPSS